MSNDLDDFMGSGAKSFPFETLGDTVTGIVFSVTKKQQTDMQTGEPKFWQDGKPKFMYEVVLQTDIREDEYDDGKRSVFLRWHSLNAVQAAVRGAGAKNIEIGGRLALQYSGNGPKKVGFNPPKMYSARYALPEPKADNEGFMTGPQDRIQDAQIVQARNVDHQGRPQSQAAPDWAQAPAQVGARPAGSTLDAFREQQAASPTNERGEFGF